MPSVNLPQRFSPSFAMYHGSIVIVLKKIEIQILTNICESLCVIKHENLSNVLFQLG